MNTLPENLEKVSAVDVFNTPKLLNEMIAQVKVVVSDHTPDVSTEAGRKEIGSIAYQISRSKTFLDDKGKEIVSEWKAKAKTIDAQRKLWRDSLDSMRDQVKAPLVDWQEKEDQRIADQTEALILIDKLKSNALVIEDSEELSIFITDLKIHYDRDWMEFIELATDKFDDAMSALTKRLDDLVKREAEQKELAELRAAQEQREAEKAEEQRLEQVEQEARERKEREDAIAKKAADDARIIADAKAKEEREAIERSEQKAKAAAIAAEEEAKEAKLREKIALENSAKEKIEAEAAAKKAAEDAEVAAKKAAEDAEIAAKKAAEDAVIAERLIIEAEQASEIAEAAKREQDMKHRAKINNDALNGFVAGGLSGADAKTAVELIAKGLIQNVSIRY